MDPGTGSSLLRPAGAGKQGDMPVITIMVSSAGAGQLAESIAAGVRQRPGIVLLAGRVVPVTEAGAILQTCGAASAIVILVGSEADLAHAAFQLTEQHPELAVVRIAAHAGALAGDIFPDDLEKLIASACSLLRNGETHDMQGARSRELHYQLDQHKHQHRVLNMVMEWIDATFLLYLHRSTDAADDLPGLSVGRGTVEQLLATSCIEHGHEHDSHQQRLAAAARKVLGLLDEQVSPAEPLAILCSRLALCEEEIWALLLCLAPELDNRYQRVYGYFNDDLGRRNASLGLIAAMRGDGLDVRMALAASHRLFDWRLVHGADQEAPHADDPLRVDGTVLAWLYGNRTALLHDPQLRGAVRSASWPGARWLDAPDAAAPALAQGLDWIAGQARWLVLEGSDGSSWRALLETAALQHGKLLLRIPVAGLGDPAQCDARLLRLARAARLMGMLPVIDAGGEAAPPGHVLDRAIATFAELLTPAVLIVPDIGAAIGAFPVTAYRVLRRTCAQDGATVFAAAAQDAGLEIDATRLALLAAAYPLPFDGIERAMHLAAAQGAVGQPPAQQALLVGAACHAVASPQLPQFATRLAASFQLAELVLPPDRRQQIDELVAHVQHAGTVLATWGFGAQLPYGRGVAALFSGASGTGKTMAARAIGSALQRSVFAVDLSRVLSKYIGEMEKNLYVLFDEAEKAGAILLFDEADALFGKRSETRDAHDRYANIETAYLLQRIEAFSGLAILTTNFAQNLDRAFLRRLRFVIDFPAPGAADRERIWRQCMPAAAPLAGDIDWGYLARRIEISGGHIRQITLRAAFLAAAQGAPIGMGHLLQATRAEAVKLGMPALERELAEQVAAA